MHVLSIQILTNDYFNSTFPPMANGSHCGKLRFQLHQRFAVLRMDLQKLKSDLTIVEQSSCFNKPGTGWIRN